MAKDRGDFSEIEELVQKRKTSTARIKIREYLRLNHQSHAATIRACDWYRRLGLFREGFLLVAPKEPLRKRTKTHEPEGERLLWVIHFLNLLGASEFALRLASGLDVTELKDPKTHRILGTMFQAHFEFDLALHHLERMVQLNGEPVSYGDRVSMLDLADACAGAGQLDRAIEIAGEIHRVSTERLLRAISLSAWGEYLARKGHYEEAWVRISEAEALFSAEDRTPDRGVLAKWSAYVRARLGRVDEAMAEFDRAMNILHKYSIRPEAWLDVIRLKDSLGWLGTRDRERLMHYPGLAPGFQRLLPRPGHVEFGAGIVNPLIEIDLTCDEYLIGQDRYLGIPAELRLLAAIALTGEWGLSLLRAETVLWPDEVFSFAQLRKRSQAMLERIRKHYGVPIQLKDGFLRVQPDAVKVVVGPPRRPGIVRAGVPLNRRQLQSFYRIGSRQAEYRLKELVLSVEGK